MPDLPQGIFIGLEQSDIEAIRSAAVTLLRQGKTLMSGSVGGQNFTKQIPMPVEKVLIECRYALSFLTGEGQVRRVRPDFSRRGVIGSDPYMYGL